MDICYVNICFSLNFHSPSFIFGGKEYLWPIHLLFKYETRIVRIECAINGAVLCEFTVVDMSYVNICFSLNFQSPSFIFGGKGYLWPIHLPSKYKTWRLKIEGEMNGAVLCEFTVVDMSYVNICFSLNFQSPSFIFGGKEYLWPIHLPSKYETWKLKIECPMNGAVLCEFTVVNMTYENICFSLNFHSPSFIFGEKGYL